MKVYKTIEQENGKITIYGSNRDIELQYAKPEWNKNLEQYFRYRGNRYYLSEILAVHNPVHFPNPPEWIKEFDGYMNDSYFSGILVKFSHNFKTVKAYTFTS